MEALPANNERLLITTAVMSATLSQVLDTTIVNAAPPHMQRQLGATSQISWVLMPRASSSRISDSRRKWMQCSTSTSSRPGVFSSCWPCDAAQTAYRVGRTRSHRRYGILRDEFAWPTEHRWFRWRCSTHVNRMDTIARISSCISVGAPANIGSMYGTFPFTKITRPDR